jgi:uncharacterized protein
MKAFIHRSIRILYDEAIEGRSATFITGFKGYGLVGYIATMYLAEKLACKPAGVVLTRYMPEAVTVHGDRIVAPFEIVSCMDGKLLMLLNHDVPHDRERSLFAEAVVLWLKDIGVSEAIFIGGFDARFRTGKEELRWLATSSSKRRLPEPPMEQGLYVVGPLALLTLFAELYKLPALVILPYSDAMRPDPRAAAVAVRRVADLLSITIDVTELLKEAEKIEEMIARMEKQREAVQMGAAERVYM